MEKNQKKNGRKRAVAAAGTLLVAGALITSAAFTDFANINLNDGTSGGGIGPGQDNAFALLVAKPDAQGNPLVDPVTGDVTDDANWISAATPAGVDYRLTGIDELAPGSGSASVTIPMKNKSKGTMLTKLSIVQKGAASDPALLDALRFTVTQNGSPVGGVSNLTLAQASNLDLSTLPGKGTSKVTVQVTIANQATQAENNALADKSAYITAHIDAASN